MSRIGRLPVTIPAGVDVTIDSDGGAASSVVIKGPKGTLTHEVPAPLSVSRGEDGTLAVSRPNDERLSKSLHGLTRTLLANMVTGVTEGFTKQLEIVGTGYRVQARGGDLEFALGFSHPVLIKAPEGISLTVSAPNRFAVSGIDKQQVGEVAANIRKLRKPDPYKGKGVRYAGEVVRRKVGKAGK